MRYRKWLLMALWLLCPITTPSLKRKSFIITGKSPTSLPTRYIYMILILSLRDTMVKYGIWSSFTYVMNRLGFPGYFNPDYVELSVDSQEVLDNRLMVMGEII